ncbi:uncharacterized protein METZ01_LOCUS357316, partial [marine metagenome]
IVYGGLRFFERAEIKDAKGYVRLTENTSDNIAFERIVNFPTRGIGLTTVEKIRAYAKENHTDLFQSSIAIVNSLPTRASNSLRNFIDLIESMRDSIKNLSLGEKVKLILVESGLMTHYANDKTSKKVSKKENLEELVSAAKQYKHDIDDYEMNETQRFITLATLDSSGDSNQSNHGCVQLMTVHSAKGLEFPVVFLVGLEENLFPSGRSKDEGLLDEERRLFYVGMTRAMQSLTLTYASHRYLNGRRFFYGHSSFLNEIPSNFLSYIRNPEIYRGMSTSTPEIKNSNPKLSKSNSSPYSIGQVVKHAKFGLGTVV